MFEVQGVYANRKGKYTVLAINPPKMTVRYEDGTQADLNMRVQSRIWENIRVEFELQEAKSARLAARKRDSQTKYYIKTISIPDMDELMFPGWQENVIMSTVPDPENLKVGTRILYYAIEPQVFFGVATITGPAVPTNPKDYFFTIEQPMADFFPVDVDAAAFSLSHGISADSVDLESCPQLRSRNIDPEAFFEINEDDFELLAEMLAEVSEEEIEEIEEDDFEEEEDV